MRIVYCSNIHFLPISPSCCVHTIMPMKFDIEQFFIENFIKLFVSWAIFHIVCYSNSVECLCTIDVTASSLFFSTVQTLKRSTARRKQHVCSVVISARICFLCFCWRFFKRKVVMLDREKSLWILTHCSPKKRTKTIYHLPFRIDRQPHFFFFSQQHPKANNNVVINFV